MLSLSFCMSSIRRNRLSFEVISLNAIFTVYVQLHPDFVNLLLNYLLWLSIVNETRYHVLRVCSIFPDLVHIMLKLSISSDIIEQPLKNKFSEESTEHKHDISLSQEEFSILFESHQIALSIATLRHDQINIFQTSHSSQQPFAS